jgi:U3 small nucleolar RNA-associated protein 14
MNMQAFIATDLLNGEFAESSDSESELSDSESESNDSESESNDSESESCDSKSGNSGNMNVSESLIVSDSVGHFGTVDRHTGA